MGSFCPLPYSHAHNLFLSMWKRALVPRRRITRVELAIWPSLSGQGTLERGNSCVETSGVMRCGYINSLRRSIEFLYYG